MWPSWQATIKTDLNYIKSRSCAASHTMRPAGYRISTDKPQNAMQRPHIGANPPIARRAAQRDEKKPCSREGTGPDRMEQSYSRVDACRLLPTTNYQSCYLNYICKAVVT
ncbi:hypothetical protein Bxe_B0228 [Paraburkholderia xenovorans LB400]|uniref:Uncharacterized protein n=1 Tax=Paraburkholderia xenovorans (strain LB400) TaxID=266265 RepID=Q13JM4_PARXL|nr:hypothetical protein Bxe_B0228 [Paraburkholderia xenovorans LB400]